MSRSVYSWRGIEMMTFSDRITINLILIEEDRTVRALKLAQTVDVAEAIQTERVGIFKVIRKTLAKYQIPDYREDLPLTDVDLRNLRTAVSI